MKVLFFILLSINISVAQNERQNYIVYSNYANEAEYYFHEGNYDTAAFYFEEAFSYSNEQHPTHQKLFAYSLMQINEYDRAVDVLSRIWVNRSIDTVWFTDLSKMDKIIINEKRTLLKEEHKSVYFYREFIDSIMNMDQIVRNSIDTIPNQAVRNSMLTIQDESNSLAVLNFTRKYGFPAGKNAGWDQSAATFFLHMSPEWFVENYMLLISEVKKGNIEPWMLARGIDRMYAVEIGEDKISPYDRYNLIRKKNIIDPFLMFQNCIALGVSPYYDYNWHTKPKKTVHFDYYKENKSYYKTTLFY